MSDEKEIDLQRLGFIQSLTTIIFIQAIRESLGNETNLESSLKTMEDFAHQSFVKQIEIGTKILEDAVGKEQLEVFWLRHIKEMNDAQH